jgi:hypothetical protein
MKAAVRQHEPRTVLLEGSPLLLVEEREAGVGMIRASAFNGEMGTAIVVVNVGFNMKADRARDTITVTVAVVPVLVVTILRVRLNRSLEVLLVVHRFVLTVLVSVTI